MGDVLMGLLRKNKKLKFTLMKDEYTSNNNYFSIENEDIFKKTIDNNLSISRIILDKEDIEHT